jgi:hypothetical protein
MRINLPALIALALVAAIGISIWPRSSEPAPWASGKAIIWDHQDQTAGAQPKLRAVSDGEISVAVAVTCASYDGAPQALSAQFHTFRDLDDAEMHTRVIAMPARIRERAVFRRYAPAQIATDRGPAAEVDLLLDPTGSRVALTLVPEADGLRIAQFDPAYNHVDYFVAKGVKLHAKRMFAVRLPVGSSAAVARLETEALLRFSESCR